MHFYATQDCDTKVDFTVNTKIMGTAFSDRYAPVISVAITDATTNYSGAIIRVMFGIPGSAILPVKIDSVIGDNLTYIGNNLANLATGYYYIDISNGTTRIVTSPVWYTRNDNSLTLPVKLIAFSAQKMNSSVKITWTTAQEINTREFIVERSLNGSTWQKVATVPARGNSNSNTDYFIYDNNPAKGQNFYRLKSVDIDNKFDYSAIRQVNFDSKFTYSIYPNPVKDLLQITVDNAAGINAEIKVFNVQGQALLERKIVATSQLVQFNVSSLSPGVYFMKITNPDGIIAMEKFIKE